MGKEEMEAATGDGGETVGNSLGRAPWGRKRWKRRRGGRREAVRNSLGELRGKGARWKRLHGGRRGNRATRWWTSEIAWVVLSNCAYSRRCLHLEKNGETVQKEWRWKMQI